MSPIDRRHACVSPRDALGRAALLVQHFRARVHGPRRRHRHAQPVAELDDRADDRLELHRPARFEILQHRRLVRADFFGARHPLIDRDRQLDAELRRHRFGLRHDLADRSRRVADAGPALRASRPVSALIGLNATLPSSFTQISWRKRALIGHRNPAAINGSAILRNRSDLLPSGSPKLILLPSVWRMTPGSTTSAAK